MGCVRDGCLMLGMLQLMRCATQDKSYERLAAPMSRLCLPDQAAFHCKNLPLEKQR